MIGCTPNSPTKPSNKIYNDETKLVCYIRKKLLLKKKNTTTCYFFWLNASNH